MPSRFFSDMRILTCLLAFASLAACAMLDVKPQQAKLDATCRIVGRV